MKNLRLVLTLIVVSFCSWNNAWAVEPPVFPQAQTLESGKSYFLYNVGSDQFVYYYDYYSYSYANATTRTPIVVTQSGDNTYTLMFEGTNRYLYSDGSAMEYTTTSTTSNSRLFRIAQTDGGYTIQRNYNYSENEFVGNNNGNQYLYANFTEGNIVWQLFDATGAEAVLHYRAKKALYDALVSAADYFFAIEEYEAIYNNEASTTEELQAAADEIVRGLQYTDKVKSGESEFPIFITWGGDANYQSSPGAEDEGYVELRNGEHRTTATVEVDQDATLTYLYGRQKAIQYSFKVYLDGELYQTINNYVGYDSYNMGGDNNNHRTKRFFVELTPGKHTIEWVAYSSNTSTGTYDYSGFYLNNIAAWKTPTITVNLTQAGSLGTEVLYNVDHVKDVRKLVVNGKMNDEDWERINMMSNLFDLDLSNTEVTSLPRINPGQFFHKLKLPSGLKEIQNEALAETRVEELAFPETLTTIGEKAFYRCRIREAVLPASVTSVGQEAFKETRELEKVVWPAAATTIPNRCFYAANSISEFEIPEGVTRIEYSAFYENWCGNYSIPSSVNYIGGTAFYDTRMAEEIHIPASTSIERRAFRHTWNLKKIVIGEGATFDLGNYYGDGDFTSNYYAETFYNCQNLEEIEFPTNFAYVNYQDILSSCSSLKKVTFKSPTMVAGDYYNSFFKNCGTDIMVYVPSYLVSTYKLNNYWYNYNIMGFSTADVSDWTINNTLTFYSQDRFEGTPNIKIHGLGRWTINGDLTQNINNLSTFYREKESNKELQYSAMIMSNCDNVGITGTYTHLYYAYNRNNDYYSNYTGRWHPICLPFDLKVSDITTTNDARFAIRYYDGANRAQNGTGGNWKNYAQDDIIPAGTGFIIQANKECMFYFKAQDNDSKQNVVSNKMFVKSLEANEAEQQSNKGWNLVGNPWLCYYNIHKLNFTAPITVYDGYNKKYTAYSVIDDDYAIQPGEAFFVQCPEEVNSISFPIDGRQLTNVIESQNAAKPSGIAAKGRQLIDLELSDGEQNDKTRVVINEEASTAYETSCDASKFFDLDSNSPIIYTLENEEPLAINERPKQDGIIQLGMLFTADGTFTISTSRNDLSNVVLVDKENGAVIDLLSDDYTFTAGAGYCQERFELRLNSGVVTEIYTAEVEGNSEHQYYNLNGQKVDRPTHGIYVVNGKKVILN